MTFYIAGSELLTKAIRLLSGDQQGAFSVPCPPHKYANTFAAPGADNGMIRSIMGLYEGCALGLMSSG